MSIVIRTVVFTTQKDRKGPYRTTYFFVWLLEKANKDQYIKDLHDTVENSHNVTIQWYAPPTALGGLEMSTYIVLVASQTVLLAECPVPHK